MLLNVNFSSRTTSMDVQRNLEANVEKRMKDTYGPPPGVCMLCVYMHVQTNSTMRYKKRKCGSPVLLARAFA